MFYGTSSFRKSAFALTTIAALTAFASFPAAAQQVSSNATASPACVGIADSTAAIKCEIAESKKRTDAANARADAAEKQTQALLQVVECGKFLKAGIGNGDFTQEQMLKIAGGKVTKENGCDVARQLGFGRKADATPKGVSLQ